MLYRMLADVVVAVHLAFILFAAGGALLAWRRPWVAWLHVPSVAWAVAAVTVGVSCPLTSLELALRRLAGQEGYAGGFVDHYVEGVLYPASLTPLLRAAAFAALVVGYAGLRQQRRRRSAAGAGPDCAPRAPAPGGLPPG